MDTDGTFLPNDLLGQETPRSDDQEFLEAFEELARREKPFSYPIEYIKPRP
jgi:hypothetical protein